MKLGEMAYVDEGSGEAVLMVHGNPTWSFYYRELAKALVADGRRVIIPDHVGMGLSDKPQRTIRLEERIGHLERLMDHLNPGPVKLVVHDWGGPIGLSWALRDLKRVSSVVILNTAAFLPGPGYSLPWQIGVSRTPLGPLLIQGLNGFIEGMLRDCVMKPLSKEAKAGYRAPYKTWKDRLAVLRFIQDIPMSREHPSFEAMRWLEEKLPGLDVPTLVAWGMKDFVFTPAFYEQFRKRLPKAEFREFPKAGHLVLEDAAEELIPLIRDFAKVTR